MEKCFKYYIRSGKDVRDINGENLFADAAYEILNSSISIKNLLQYYPLKLNDEMKYKSKLQNLELKIELLKQNNVSMNIMGDYQCFSIKLGHNTSTNKIVVPYCEDILQAYKREFLHSLDWSALNIGESTYLERLLRELLNNYSANDICTWLNKLYMDNLKNVLVECTILHAISHLEYEEIYPNGQLIALAAMTHKSDLVLEYAIKVFENWNSKLSLEILDTVNLRSNWANKELNRVRRYIEKYGDDYSELLN